MNAHGDSLDAWLDFQRGERDVEPRFKCCECGRAAEGDVSLGDEHLCNACSDRMAEEAAEDIDDGAKFSCRICGRTLSIDDRDCECSPAGGAR